MRSEWSNRHLLGMSTWRWMADRILCEELDFKSRNICMYSFGHLRDARGERIIETRMHSTCMYN